MSVFTGYFFFFKQKTAYEMRISDWSSDVCSSDLPAVPPSAENTTRTNLRGLSHVDHGRSPSSYRQGVFDAPLGGCRRGGAGGRRSEARRVGKECDSRYRSRLSPSH